MCVKGCQVFKQFFAVVICGPAMPAPRALQVFKAPPSHFQIQQVIQNHVIGKVEPVPHIYAEKPRISVVPIHIPVDILYH